MHVACCCANILCHLFTKYRKNEAKRREVGFNAVRIRLKKCFSDFKKSEKCFSDEMFSRRDTHELDVLLFWLSPLQEIVKISLM